MYCPLEYDRLSFLVLNLIWLVDDLYPDILSWHWWTKAPGKPANPVNPKYFPIFHVMNVFLEGAYCKESISVLCQLNLTPLNPLSVHPSVRSSVRPAMSVLGPKGPSQPQELERSPSLDPWGCTLGAGPLGLYPWSWTLEVVPLGLYPWSWTLEVVPLGPDSWATLGDLWQCLTILGVP